MSDFVFLRSEKHEQIALKPVIKKLREMLKGLPPNDVASSMHEYCGSWGTLLVREGHYHGFSPYENAGYLALVLGGPVLHFAENDFILDQGSSAATQLIFERWLAGQLKPDVDLDGPFALIVVDKDSGQLCCVTDLMLFIPVFAHATANALVVGSHIDVTGRALAATRSTKASEVGDALPIGFDEVSIADFILHGAVTYPYTVYKDLWQLPPASEITFNNSSTVEHASDGSQAMQTNCYWAAEENNQFKTINEAAEYVKAGVETYISKLAETLSAKPIAQFISAGEDSRVLAGLLSNALADAGAPRLQDAQVYTDSFNKECKIAEKAAALYRINFSSVLRSPMHYLSILPDATQLTGSQFQYHHSHPYKVQPDESLLSYSAVFGGFSADVFLKGQYTRKSQRREQLRFLPQKSLSGERHSQPVRSTLFAKSVCDQITQRRREHIQRVEKFRKESVHEWFAIWPATMRKALPNLIANRRLFRSYEPFVANSVVKAAAFTPTAWRLNRRLFHQAFKHSLLQSRFLRHSDGRYPYFAWWLNIPGYTLESYRKAWRRRFAKGAPPEGPWCNWVRLKNSTEWRARLVNAEEVARNWRLIEENAQFGQQGHEQQLNLMQVITVLNQGDT